MPDVHLLRSLTDPRPVCGAPLAEHGTTTLGLVSCARCRLGVGPGISEAALMGALKREAVARGYLFFHVYTSKRSDPGWPDCAIVHPTGDRTLYLLECKRQGEHPTLAQHRWLSALARVTTV